MLAAFLLAQAESIRQIQDRRKTIWQLYHRQLQPLADKGLFGFPVVPSYATNNAHMFYLVCESMDQRTGIIQQLKRHNILAVFHYLSLHRSAFMQQRIAPVELPNADRYSDNLLRLPLYYELSEAHIATICGIITKYLHQA